MISILSAGTNILTECELNIFPSISLLVIVACAGVMGGRSVRLIDH